MKNDPSISIIVPVYNAERFLDRCLKSIYSQTFSDYEIILVNDGSKDNSLALCRAYAEKDPRITVIDKENGGAGSARNKGIEIAKGEYLAFPDVDDWFEPKMYEDLYNLAKKGDYDIVFSGANYYSQKGGELIYTHSVKCDSLAFETALDCRLNVMKFFPTSTIFDVPWNKLYKREVAVKKNVRFSDHKRCQDAMFNIDFYDRAEKVASTDKCYYNYIVNDTAGVQRKFPKNYIDINIAYFSHLITILNEWGVYSGEIKVHYDTSFVIAVYETMNMFDNPLWKMNKNEKAEYVKSILERPEIQSMIARADVKKEERWQIDILKNKDYKTVFKLHKKEKFKNALRNCRPLMKFYRFFKKNG